uniref:ELF4 protein n=1 Tax=Manihot esculenta TaxID=3983 RepID=F1CEX2_MANES|nr:ELF4 protein [Manihot esculenta]
MNNNSNHKSSRRRHKHTADDDDDEGDPEVWSTFNSTFRQVQSVLDRNRNLIQQVNENHQSRIPDNMVKNVALIQELNGNISKVVSLYSDLNSNFTTNYQQRNGSGSGNSNSSGRS